MSDSRHQEGLLTRRTVTPLPVAASPVQGEAATARAIDEVTELLGTLEQDNVRRLSVTLLIDLLALEADRSRAAELVCDATVLGEDLLLAGDYDGAREVIRALARHAADSRSVASEAARMALEGLVTTVAFREAADCAGEMDDIGPSYIGALLRAHVPSALRARRAS